MALFNIEHPRASRPVPPRCLPAQVPTIGHYLIDMEKFFSEAYEALYDKKVKCDIAMATPFPNEDLCGHKLCDYYAARYEPKRSGFSLGLPWILCPKEQVFSMWRRFSEGF